jgi:DNA-binding transcriptional MerR regulator|tara:strand:+ start:381 stop:737 length:357 start_codon:yes stop_codon:yes gene_type:complete
MYLPNKLFFKIGEVAKLARVEPYVLRYWETEFKNLRPKKNEKGQRLYQKKEVQLALGIKKLLHEEGYTIEGAKKVLRLRNKKDKKGSSQSSILFDREKVIEAIKDLKKELQSILKQLS